MQDVDSDVIFTPYWNSHSCRERERESFKGSLLEQDGHMWCYQREQCNLCWS